MTTVTITRPRKRMTTKEDDMYNNKRDDSMIRKEDTIYVKREVQILSHNACGTRVYIRKKLAIITTNRPVDNY